MYILCIYLYNVCVYIYIYIYIYLYIYIPGARPRIEPARGDHPPRSAPPRDHEVTENVNMYM